MIASSAPTTSINKRPLDPRTTLGLGLAILFFIVSGAIAYSNIGGGR